MCPGDPYGAEPPRDTQEVHRSHQRRSSGFQCADKVLNNESHLLQGRREEYAGREQNKRKILAYRELSSELEDKCMFSCKLLVGSSEIIRTVLRFGVPYLDVGVDSCKAAKGTTRHGKGANVVDGEMACIKNCTKVSRMLHLVASESRLCARVVSNSLT